MNIAIVHMGGVGDLVQAMPALRAVRAKWPAARVTLVGRPERAALARMAGLVDTCIDYDGSVPVAADLAVDFLGGPGPAARVAAPERATVDPLPPDDWTRPAAAWILGDAAARLDLPPIPDVPEIPVAAEAAEAARHALAARGVRGQFVAIHPGSGSPTKNWPMERFAAIARRIAEEAGRQVVWLAGPAERERGTMPPALSTSTRAGLAGAVFADLAIDEVAGVLAAADAYLGNDSGITQVAAAVRRPRSQAGPRATDATPTVALFGPTDPRVWGPRGTHVRIVRSAGGRMEGIAAEDVWDALGPMLR